MLCIKCKENNTIGEEFQYCIVCRDETGMCWRCTKEKRHTILGELRDCCRACLIIEDGACTKCGGPSDGTDSKVCFECKPDQ